MTRKRGNVLDGLRHQRVVLGQDAGHIREQFAVRGQRLGGPAILPEAVGEVAAVLEGGGLAWTAVDMGDLDAVAAAIRPETALVWTETPSNPLLKVTDIAVGTALSPLHRAEQVGEQDHHEHVEQVQVHVA